MLQVESNSSHRDNACLGLRLEAVPGCSKDLAVVVGEAVGRHGCGGGVLTGFVVWMVVFCATIVLESRL